MFAWYLGFVFAEYNFMHHATCCYTDDVDQWVVLTVIHKSGDVVI